LGGRENVGKRWLSFLKNHREMVAAMDFFTVTTITFRVLYCFFVISHGRRKILHFNATEHPTSAWIVQQLREAFPEDAAPRYLILDRDSKYAGEAKKMPKHLGSQLIRTAYRVPGRTESQSDGLAAAAGNYWTRCSFSMNVTSGG
jgi:putative transposase